MLLLKLGGDGSTDVQAVARDLASLESPVVMVHGANELRNSVARKMGVELRTVTSPSGVSSVVSTDELIDLQMMTYAGLANKQIVEALQREGISAVGLTGVDGGLIRGKRKSHFRAVIEGKRKVIRDRSASPVEVNVHLLQILLDGGYCPVITVPILDEQGVAVNTENDEIVALLAASLDVERVIFLIGEEGVLSDPADASSVIPEIGGNMLQVLLQKASGRFQRKLMAVRRMLKAGVKEVRIGLGRGDRPITSLLAGRGGTTIRP